MNDILISVDLHTISGDELLAAIDVLHEVANDDRHLTTVERVQLQLEHRLDWDSGLARSVAAWLVKGIPILRNVRDYRAADMVRLSLWKRLEVVGDEAPRNQALANARLLAAAPALLAAVEAAKLALDTAPERGLLTDEEVEAYDLIEAALALARVEVVDD